MFFVRILGIGIGKMIERVGTALGDEIIHGNALLLGNGTQTVYKFFG